jgi:hypothetical protein
VLAVLPVIAGVIVVLWFPETARRELEDTSGDTVPARLPV